MRFIPLVIVAILVLTAGIPAAQSAPKSRIIALTTDANEKRNYHAEGCVVTHDLLDATAFECDDEVSKKHVATGKAIRDEVLNVIDINADTQIGADQVWAGTPPYTGKNVKVAVLDTGVDYNHPQLTSSTCSTCGKSFVSYTTSFMDDHGHGTHVTGIITSDGLTGGSTSKGVAPEADVWMAKVCNGSGSCYTADMAAAMEYIVNNNIAKVMSISIGGGGTTAANCDSDYLANKVNWAVSNGVTAAIAAGNAGNVISSPGCASGAIAVGAVNINDVRASFSGTGLALDIMAPGVSIYSTLPANTYASWSGTSMATPHVAATIALMREKNSGLTDSQIKNALYSTAKDLGAAGWDSSYGWGREVADAAVNAAPASGAFDFSINVSPVTAAVTQGNGAPGTLTTTLISGTSQLVSLTSTIVPVEPSISVVFAPPSGNAGFASAMTVTTLSTTPVGGYQITIAGTGGGQTRSTTFTLTVNPASTSNMVVVISTDKSTYARNSMAQITVKVTNSVTSSGVAGTTVQLTIKDASGGSSVRTLTTDSSGNALTKYKIQRNAPIGMYDLSAGASAPGYNPNSALSSFIVA